MFSSGAFSGCLARWPVCRGKWQLPCPGAELLGLSSFSTTWELYDLGQGIDHSMPQFPHL